MRSKSSSRSVQKVARRVPSSSATRSNSPMGVGSRSRNRCSASDMTVFIVITLESGFLGDKASRRGVGSRQGVGGRQPGNGLMGGTAQIEQDVHSTQGIK